MFNQLFSESVLIKQLNVEDDIEVASYPASGAFIDVSNFKRCAFLVGAGTLDSELTFQVQQATAINGTPKDLTNAVVVVPADGDDKWYMVEFQVDHLDTDGGYRFVTLKSTGAAGTNDYAAIFFFGFNPGYRPVTQGADKGEVVYVAG